MMQAQRVQLCLTNSRYMPLGALLQPRSVTCVALIAARMGPSDPRLSHLSGTAPHQAFEVRRLHVTLYKNITRD